MRNLQELETPALLDLLAQYTEKLTRLLKEFTDKNPRYVRYKETLIRIDQELRRRSDPGWNSRRSSKKNGHRSK